MEAVRVVLADRDPLIRGAIRLACAGRNVHVVAETSRAEELVELCRIEQPDVVVAAARLDDGDLDRHIDAVLDDCASVLLLCDDPSPERLTALLAMGVCGFLMYDTALGQVADAVVDVAGGAAVLHPSAAGTILSQWRRLRRDAGEHGLSGRADLTPRETDVLRAMADGLAAKAIARRLGVAVKTVENHKIRIFDKLGARSQAHAVSVAIGHGILAATPVGAAVED